MLVLFDIDGTLLLTQNAGRDAMIEAGRALFGEAFTLEGVEIAGRLDPLIFAEAAQRCGIEQAHHHHDRFRDAYRDTLEQRFRRNPTAQLLPGAGELVDAVRRVESMTAGLLTGNYPETGRLKISSAGLDPSLFTVAAWGSDGGHRRELVVVAFREYRRVIGREIDPSDVVIIGDTPHDIDCAQANGCRSIGVSTGRFDRETLGRAGADLVVEDLRETELLLDWLAGSGQPLLD